ncbi:MAG: DNA gyrase subunit A [Euryarchaeota archaeon]|nr:DNA gyrase subunit A [Euryarchaeota archaeon]
MVGECFAAGTRVLTERGLIPIEEVQLGEKVYTQSGRAQVTELYEMPERALLRITLENGVSVVATPSQPFKVIGRGLSYEWKEAKDLSPSDHVVMRLDYPDDVPFVALSKWKGKDKQLNENIAYLIGQFLADGHIEKVRSNSSIHKGVFNFFSSSVEVIEHIHGLLKNEFDYESTIQCRCANQDEYLPGQPIMHWIRISDNDLNDYLANNFGIDWTWGAQTKRVPELFYRSPKAVIGALLSGLMDGGGSVHKSRNVVNYSTMSEALANDVQSLMQQLGVLSQRYIQDKTDSVGLVRGDALQRNGPSRAIEVTGRSVKTLSKHINLYDECKKERIERIGGSQIKTSAFDGIPYASEAVLNNSSEHHLGGGWFEDDYGNQFRSGTFYPNGNEIPFSSQSKEDSLGRTQITDRGPRSKLCMIGADLAPIINEVVNNNIYFMQVKKVQGAPPAHTYDLQVAGAHEFVANGVIVHNCLGKYHPHGDTAVYDSLVRLAQDFSLRYPLVEGQGNFGSVDGDEAAAMRYTECRLHARAEDMLADLEKDTVDWGDNFDASLKEPLVLPSKLPNLLINGSSGIAVGMATNMPPHNLREVADAIVHLVDNPEAEVMDLMQFIKGPDFPTGGSIHGLSGIVEAYQTGRGKLKVRARAHFEDAENRKRIIVDEIPYQVNKALLIESIAELVKEKRIDGITDLRDESDREGMRIVIDLRKDVMEEIVLNQLYQHTQMEVTFGVINLALVNNQPRVLTLKEELQIFIQHRHEVIVRRTRYDLAQARKRDHILQGLVKAIGALDETLRIIRSAKSPEEARAGLMARFDLDEEQAKAILDMRLQKLTGMELEAIQLEFQEIERLIRDLEDILANEARILGIIKAEALEMREKYGDERRTEIVAQALDMDIEDLIPNEEMVLMITQDGYIKRMPLDTYKQQRRGGLGLMGMETKEEDVVTDLFVSMTHDSVLFFTNLGKMYSLKAWQVPVGSRQSKGKPIVNLLPKLEEGERIMATRPITKMAGEHYLVFATRAGIVKKTPLAAYANVSSRGLIALGLDEGDKLVDVKLTDGSKEIILATKKGLAVRFDEAQVRPMGRPARGVIGIRPEEGDEVVSMAIVDGGSALLTVTENGYGKISMVGKRDAEDERDTYRKTNRGGKGVITIRTEGRNGNVVAVMEVEQDDELILATANGMVQRIRVADIRVMGRATQGVTVMDLREGDKVIAVARLAGRKERQAVQDAEAHPDAGLSPGRMEEGADDPAPEEGKG